MSDRCRMDLDLAGFLVRVDVDAGEERRLRERYGAYETAHAPVFTLTVAYEPGRTLEQPEGLRYPQPRCEEAGGRIVFSRRHEVLEVEPAARRATLVVDRTPDSFRPVEPPSVESALRILLSMDLPGRHGILVHAAGAGTPKGAVLFPAFGGGGKTTTARKLPHSQVLSDDQVALLRTGDGWVAHALPFVGMYGKPTVPQAHPLRAIALLAKSAEPRLERLRPAAALSRVLTCIVQYRPGAEAQVFALADELVREVPVSELALDLETPLEPWLDALTR